MGTKAAPSAYDCYANAAPDEPLFILLGRDKHAPTLVWLWAVLRELDDEKPEVVTEARQVCVDMLQWAADHGRQTIGLGQAVLAGVLDLIRAANFAVKDARNSPSTLDAVRAFFTHTKFDTAEK